MSPLLFGTVYRFSPDTPYGTLFEFAHDRIRQNNLQIPRDQFNYLNSTQGDVRILNPETNLLSNENASYVVENEPFVAAAVQTLNQKGKRVAKALRQAIKESLTDFLESNAVDPKTGKPC